MNPSFPVFPLYFLASLAGIYVLAAAKPLLLPFVIALFIWYLMHALAEGYHRLLPRFPRLCFGLGIASFFAFIWAPIQFVEHHLQDAVQLAPTYRANIEAMLAKAFGALHLEQADVVQRIRDSLDVGSLLSGIAEGLASAASNTVLILLYVVFLILEQRSFPRKLVAMSGDADRAKRWQSIVRDVHKRVRGYLWVKTLASILTAVLSYGVMWGVGLDFAGFWSVLVFFFNFIPNLGGLLSIALPALQALAQYDSFTPLLILVAGTGAIQFAIGNFMEPRLIGNTVNLSPLVILLSLVLWGTIWGVAGMFLCVPLTVIVMIVLAEFPSSRPIAVLLSQDGKI
jgi:AI-2 transport protein TqsA